MKWKELKECYRYTLCVDSLLLANSHLQECSVLRYIIYIEEEGVGSNLNSSTEMSCRLAFYGKILNVCPSRRVSVYRAMNHWTWSPSISTNQSKRKRSLIERMTLIRILVGISSRKVEMLHQYCSWLSFTSLVRWHDHSNRTGSTGTNWKCFWKDGKV